jgi:hypothetical protein
MLPTLLFVFCFGDRVLLTALVGLEFEILLPPPPVYMGLQMLTAISGSHLITFLFDGTGIQIQGFEFARQALSHLSHTSSSFCFGYFGDGVSRTICLGWPQTTIPNSQDYKCEPPVSSFNNFFDRICFLVVRSW